MAYYTGTVNSFSDLKTVIENAAVEAGWNLTDGILSKYGHYVKLETGTYASTSYPYLSIKAATGQSGSTLTGQVGAGAKMYSSKNLILTWPGIYHIHAFDREIYCFLNSNVDLYQTLVFGVSDMPGIGGTGGWYGSMARINVDQNPISTNNPDNKMTVVCSDWAQKIDVYLGHDQNPAASLAPPFWSCRPYQSEITNLNAQINIGLGYDGWANPQGYGFSAVGALVTSVPSMLNNGHVLLPVKCVVARPAGGRTLVLQHEHIRWIRNDLVENDQIIEYGADKWKCYPVLRRNLSARNGHQGASWGVVDHSGTFGYAVRYDGP